WRRYFHGVPLSFRSQRQGDWGARLTSALEEALTKHDMVCVWPTHIPTLPSGILETAATLYPKALFTPERHGGVAFFSLASIHATALKKITAVRWQTPAAAADFLKVLQAVGVPVVQRGRVSALRSVNDFPRVIRELEEKQDSAALQALYNTLE
ncbi:MAG TPA: hypothetical protein PLY93_03925, partial [Turneriella sp.]|nr:hypothetical protein [Turneriella sp.]